jgi:cellulose synthase/poly-beta-1,6-N-acetylglucosamine synthase-like glycosyltransferase
MLAYAALADAGGFFTLFSAGWWITTLALHAPYLFIIAFLVGGLIERFGWFAKGRQAELPGRLPDAHPTVCVQLPMFNEHAVAQRLIEAACAISWPRDRFSVQVLDDSTDQDTADLVQAVAARMRMAGTRCEVLHRKDRQGYKAGALEAGRKATDAEFLVIFDADFLPASDFLQRAMPYFYDGEGRLHGDLALVQAQWGHLNHDQSALTKSQSLWVDDHHTLQMAWRSAMWRFVNFTGTAGIWRAAAIEKAGGWRGASLVEDCELSFRNLFAGYRTRFIKEIVVPAELPATFTAYKAQQKRWTQGWVQLQRMHFDTLLRRHESSLVRRLHLLYHMCLSWQWPAWALWLAVLPFLIVTNHWFGAVNPTAGLIFYLAPFLLWLVSSTVLATLATRHTYAGPRNLRAVTSRLLRCLPYMLINTGMLPHQFSAFCEGLFGSMHSEFERTPKAATVTAGVQGTAQTTSGSSFSPAGASMPASKLYRVKVHWPYVIAELFFVLLQYGWAAVFFSQGNLLCALAAAYIGTCVAGLMWFYGDHAGRRAFILQRSHRAK